jgi:hypothetical protein
MKHILLLPFALLFFFTSQAQIVINEVGADVGNFENAGGEWLELVNIGTTPFDLSCYRLSNGSTEMTFPFGLVVLPSQYLLIGNAAKMMCSTCDYKELQNQFNLNTSGFGDGIGNYTNTVFLNTDLLGNGGCGCLFGSGAFNNGTGLGDRIVLFDDNGNVVDAMMYGGGNYYGNNSLTLNFTSIPNCVPLSGVTFPAPSSPVFNGRSICNDVTSCNSSYARLPDGNNGATVTWNQTGNLSCSGCTIPCGPATNTASNDLPTPGLPNSTNTWSATLDGNPVTSFNTPLTVCGATPITFIYESYGFTNTALTPLQPSGLLGSYVSINNGTPTSYTGSSFNASQGTTTLVASLIPGPGTTQYTFVMGESNVNCSSCPGTATLADVNNNASAARECYITRTVTVVREEPLGGTPNVTCSILGSITVSGATGTNLKYELQKQTTIGGLFTTIAGPQNSSLFSGVVDDDADPLLPNYQVVVTTQNTVCTNPTGLIAAVPTTCLGNPACATYVTTNPGAPTFNPPSGSIACAAGNLQFTVDINGVCTNGTVDLLYDFNPSFDPYTSGTLMGSAPTTVGITPPTTTATSKVFINEFTPRPPLGTCAGTQNGPNPNSGEWIELYNPGPTNVDIGGWSISDGDWTTTIPAGVTILANSHYLIGGGGTLCSSGALPDLNVETCNCSSVSPASQDIMNLTDANEQIALFDCSGNLIDGVIWGAGQGLPDTTANTAWATGCGNYIVQKNVNIPSTIVNTGASLGGGTNVGRYRTSTNTWVTTTTALLNATPKATNPGGNWTGTTIPFGTNCPPPPVTATITVPMPDTCDQFNATNFTVKAIYKPDPVAPCTKAAVTATATYTINPCTLLTLGSDGEYCQPNTAPVTLTPSDPLVGNFDVTLTNGTNNVTLNALTGAGPFNGTVANSGLWTINSITPPTGVCAPKKVGSANIIIHPIPAITSSPTSVGSCYLYGYDLSNINLLLTTNPPASTFNWYDAPVNGNLISPTLVYPTNATTYYAEPSTGNPANCNGTRVPVLVDVTPIPDVPTIQCVNDTLKILPLASNCVPTPCLSGVDYSPNGLNWSAATAYTTSDPGWSGWGVSPNNQLYIRNLAQASCYVIITYFAPCANPLPTTVFGFNGNLMPNKQVELKWFTGNEELVDRFIVERSGDKLNFERLTEVEAKNGVSNTYNSWDTNPLAMDNYYRLKIMDEDGKFEYSNIIAVSNPVNESAVSALFPNPCLDEIQFAVQGVKTERCSYEVQDMTGKVIANEQTLIHSGYNSIPVLTKSLASGMYMLHITIGNRVVNKTFRKE